MSLWIKFMESGGIRCDQRESGSFPMSSGSIRLGREKSEVKIKRLGIDYQGSVLCQVA